MKRSGFIILLFIFMSITIKTFSQELAFTASGDTVILFSNNTWDYYDNYLNNNENMSQFRMNDKQFVKSDQSKKKITGTNQAYEIWYDNAKWKRIPPEGLNAEADAALQLINGDVYAMVIFEEIEIPLENLSQIAYENALIVAPDMKLVDREYRIVNGDSLVWMRMDGTTQGMKISYYSYYASNTKGSIQFHTFTGQNLIDKYKDEIEELLNGLILND